MRKILGIVLGILLSCALTYYLINTWRGIQFILTYAVITAISGFIGGLVSRDFKAGFLSGLLAGMIGVPLTTIYIASPVLELPFGFLLTSSYSQNLGSYILFGLIGGTVGITGSWIESKLIRQRQK